LLQCPSCKKAVHQTCGGLIYANKGRCLYCQTQEIFEIPPGASIQALQDEIAFLQEMVPPLAVTDDGIRVYRAPRQRHMQGPQVPVPHAHRVFQKMIRDILHNQPDDHDLPRESAGRAWFRALYHENWARRYHAHSMVQYYKLGELLNIKIGELGRRSDATKIAIQWAEEQYKSTTGRTVSPEHKKDVIMKAKRAFWLFLSLTPHAIRKVRSVTPTDLRRLKIDEAIYVNQMIRDHLQSHGNTEEIEG
jgi:hypothetical protein